MSRHNKAKEYTSKLRDQRLVPECYSAYLAGYAAALKSIERFVNKQADEEIGKVIKELEAEGVAA